MPGIESGFSTVATSFSGVWIISVMTIALVIAGITWKFGRGFALAAGVFCGGIVAAAAPGLATYIYNTFHTGGGAAGILSLGLNDRGPTSTQVEHDGMTVTLPRAVRLA